MVFASLLFLFVFLPLNLLFYYSTKNAQWRNAVLIIFSLAFYGWGEPIWISLLILSSFFDWANALFIDKHKGTKWAKVGVTVTVIFNLALLATFKYDKFIVMAPVWASNPAPPVNNVLELLPRRDTLSLFLVSSSGSSAKKRILARLEAAGFRGVEYMDIKRAD